jgi:hypothetical protein
VKGVSDDDLHIYVSRVSMDRFYIRSIVLPGRFWLPLHLFLIAHQRSKLIGRQVARSVTNAMMASVDHEAMLVVVGNAQLDVGNAQLDVGKV